MTIVGRRSGASPYAERCAPSRRHVNDDARPPPRAPHFAAAIASTSGNSSSSTSWPKTVRAVRGMGFRSSSFYRPSASLRAFASTSATFTGRPSSRSLSSAAAMKA